jgi:hypothetical protein
MALALGTNCGFVSVAPSSDPSGTSSQISSRSYSLKDTSSAAATKITEIGWYEDGTSNDKNFEIALYAADGATVPGEAGTRIYYAATNAKTSSGNMWHTVTVDWSISASTAYWITVQVVTGDGTTWTNSAASGGSGYDRKTEETLSDPYGGGTLYDADGMISIYALYEEGEPPPPGIKLNIGDVWKDVTDVQINIGDVWKTVTKGEVNIGDVWKTFYGS